MRTQQEMMDLILGFAQSDERVRAVFLNGSRANPHAPRDIYQDYDIVYVVRELESFKADQRWLDVFGERLIMQMPEAMRNPSGDGHFNWMMLFCDGNRLDLTLMPIALFAQMQQDSLTRALLDKDGILPPFPPPDDSDYLVQRPDQLDYDSCCNNFWWCMQNVAKGIAREELPYAMLMYHQVVREELHDMISWYIGTQNDFAVSAGKLGKYFRRYLPPPLYAQYVKTYSDASPAAFWQAIFSCCALFRTLAQAVAGALGYAYNCGDDQGIMHYLRRVKDGVLD